MNYIVTEQLQVLIYRESILDPVIFQPYYPDGQPFESYLAAENWAVAWIANAENYSPNEEESE